MAKHWHETQQIAVKRIAKRLFVIKQKLAYLLDKEWDNLSTGDGNKIATIRMQIAELEQKYKE